MTEIPIWQKMNLTVEEAAMYSNIGQNRISDMINDPNCPFVLYVGRKRLIKRTAFEKFIESQVEI